ncbi:hypothetical protein IAI51_00265 [Pseudomonas sp. N40(2020)]|uniref:hypothetical protein n=1 Tax=Pseudomonas sp. N40(2020) TaxID=2767798 RepID=UPI00165727E0|nr:hypothetical protein [Pseudomonas sp. N40(2020)]MBC8994966.1 hypothetical protein [Pseudomonas sp. N40(2020)]
MNTGDKQAISSWQVVVYDDCVSFKRVDDGQMLESYPHVSISKAAVYAMAIVHGLQPPRDFRPCDKPIEAHGDDEIKEAETDLLKAQQRCLEQKTHFMVGAIHKCEPSTDNQLRSEQFIVAALRMGS